jgi:hypothetical protein
LTFYALRNAGSPSEDITNGLRICIQRVACKFQTFNRSGSGFFIAGAAGVGDEYGNVTQVGSVARCRFDSDFSRYADDDKGVDAAISQSKVQPRRFDG